MPVGVAVCAMWACLFLTQVLGDEYSCQVERDSSFVSLVQLEAKLQKTLTEKQPKVASTPKIKTARKLEAKRGSFSHVAKKKAHVPSMQTTQKGLKPKAKQGSFSRVAGVQSINATSDVLAATPPVLGNVATGLKTRQVSASPDVSIVNKTLDTIEGLVESINSSAIAMLSDVVSASAAFSDVLTEVQSSVDEATTTQEENADSDDGDAAESEELKSFISFATTCLAAVNKTVLSVNEQVPQLQAQIDSTLSQIMPPLRSKADEIFGAVNGATEQLDDISAKGLPSGDASLLDKSIHGAVKNEIKHSGKLSLLEERASRGKMAASKARLEFAIARKGGSSSGICDTVQAKISAANDTVNGFSEMLSSVNSTFIDAVDAVTNAVETGLMAIVNATQEKIDAAEDADDDRIKKAVSVLSTGAEKLQDLSQKLPETSDKFLGDAETAIVKAQVSLASLSDNLEDMKSVAETACSVASGGLPGSVTDVKDMPASSR